MKTKKQREIAKARGWASADAEPGSKQAREQELLRLAVDGLAAGASGFDSAAVAKAMASMELSKEEAQGRALSSPVSSLARKAAMQLALHGAWAEIAALAPKWGRAMFPDGWHGSKAARAAWRMAKGGPEGRRALEAVAAAAEDFYGGKEQTMARVVAEGSPLILAIDEGDFETAGYFLEKVRQGRDERGRRQAMLCVGTKALNSRGSGVAALREMIARDPRAWAGAYARVGEPGAQGISDASGVASVFERCLRRGLRDMADMMAAADPKAARAGASMRWRGWDRDPAGSARVLLGIGADPAGKAPPENEFEDGLSPLGVAARMAPEKGAPFAAVLITAGADPREVDKGGMSAIAAAMGRWTWAAIRDVLGGRPEDLTAKAAGLASDGAALPAWAHALRAARRRGAQAGAGLEDDDGRLREIARVAGKPDLSGFSAEDVDLGLAAAMGGGLSLCVEFFAEARMRLGLGAAPSWLAREIFLPEMGRRKDLRGPRLLECLAIAVEKARLDPCEPFAQGPGHARAPKDASLIGCAVACIWASELMEDLEDSEVLALALVRWGADPARAMAEVRRGGGGPAAAGAAAGIGGALERLRAESERVALRGLVADPGQAAGGRRASR